MFEEYVRLCLAELRFELLSLRYGISLNDGLEDADYRRQLFNVVEKVEELERSFRQVRSNGDLDEIGGD